MNNIIGTAKKTIIDGEYCCSINWQTGEIKSDKIKFHPWGKKKLMNWLLTLTASDQCPPCADSYKGSTERGIGG